MAEKILTVEIEDFLNFLNDSVDYREGFEVFLDSGGKDQTTNLDKWNEYFSATTICLEDSNPSPFKYYKMDTDIIGFFSREVTPLQKLVIDRSVKLSKLTINTRNSLSIHLDGDRTGLNVRLMTLENPTGKKIDITMDFPTHGSVELGSLTLLGIKTESTDGDLPSTFHVREEMQVVGPTTITDMNVEGSVDSIKPLNSLEVSPNVPVDSLRDVLDVRHLKLADLSGNCKHPASTVNIRKLFTNDSDFDEREPGDEVTINSNLNPFIKERLYERYHLELGRSYISRAQTLYLSHKNYCMELIPLADKVFEVLDYEFLSLTELVWKVKGSFRVGRFFIPGTAKDSVLVTSEHISMWKEGDIVTFGEGFWVTTNPTLNVFSDKTMIPELITATYLEDK